MIAWYIPLILIGTVSLVAIAIILIADYLTPGIRYKEIEKDHKKQDEKIDKIIKDSREELEAFEKKCYDTWEGKDK